MNELTQWTEAHPYGTGGLVVLAILILWMAISLGPDLMRYIRISRM